MSNITTGITRHDALAKVWEFAKENGFTETDTYFDGIGETLDKMIKSLESKRVATGPSKIQKENAKLLTSKLDIILAAGEAGITAREFAIAALAPTPDGKPATQKATRVLVQGVNDGLLVKVPQQKKSAPMRYAIPAADTDADTDTD